MPDASQTFGPVAEECWRIWNHYFKDMFKLREGDAAPPAWGNGKFDLHGMLKDEELKERFGKEWDEGTASMTFRKFGVGGVISEADVVLNAAMSWTLNNAEVFEGADATCFRYTLMREFSQLLGLQQPVTGTLSLRCQAARTYTAFSLPFGFDLFELRPIYANNVEPRREVQAHLFYTDESNEWKDAAIPDELQAGKQFELTGLWIENAGTQPRKSPSPCF